MSSKKSQATELYGDLQKLKSLFIQKKLANDLGTSEAEKQCNAKIKIICGKISRNKLTKKLLRKHDAEVQKAMSERDELMRNGELSETEKQEPGHQVISDKLAKLDSIISNRIDATHSQDIYEKLYHDGQKIDSILFEQLSAKLLEIGIDEKALGKRRFMSQDKGLAKSKQAMIDLIADTKRKHNAGGDLKTKGEARHQSQKVKHQAREAYKDLRFGGLRRLFGSDVAKQAYEEYQGAKAEDRAKQKDRNAAKRSYQDAFEGQEKSEKQARKRLKSSMPDHARYIMEEFLKKQERLLDEGKSSPEATNAALDKMQEDVNKSFDVLLNISSDVKASIASANDHDNPTVTAPAVPPPPDVDAVVAPPAEPIDSASETQNNDVVDLAANLAVNSHSVVRQPTGHVYGTLPVPRVNFPERRKILISALEQANSLQEFQEHISQYRETLISERREYGQDALGASYDKEINEISEFETTMQRQQDLRVCKDFARPHLITSEHRQSMPSPQSERHPMTRNRSQSDIGPGAQAQAGPPPSQYQQMGPPTRNTQMQGARDAEGNRVQGEVGVYGNRNVAMDAEVDQPNPERSQVIQPGNPTPWQADNTQSQHPSQATTAESGPNASEQYAALPPRENWHERGGSKLPESGQGDPPPPPSNAQAQQAAASGRRDAAGPGADNKNLFDPKDGDNENDADPENTDAPKYW